MMDTRQSGAFSLLPACLAGLALVLVFAFETPDVLAGSGHRIDKYTIRNGLSQNSANRMVMDNQGFLWIATQDGLNRFDGYSFRVFRPDPEDTLSLDDGFIFDMKIASDGNIWLLTTQGVNEFNPITEKTTRWSWIFEGDTTFIPTALLSLQPIPGGKVLVAATNRLYEIDTDTRTLRIFRHEPKDPTSLPAPRINSFLVDQSGRIWIGTNRGLSQFDPSTGRFRIYSGVVINNPTEAFSGTIYQIFQNSSGKIWLLTGKGLKWFDPATGIYHPTIISWNEKAAPSFADLVEGHDGNLWVAIYAEGIVLYDPETNDIVRRITAGESEGHLTSDMVQTLYHDPNGMIWAGTDGYGLNRIDSRPTRFFSISKSGYPLKDPVTMAVFRHRDQLWLGSYGGGLSRVDLPSNQFNSYVAGDGSRFAPNTDRIMAIDMDSAGFLWVGTDNGGFSKHNLQTGTIERYGRSRTGKYQFPSDAIYRFYRDLTGNWFVCGSQGAYQVFPDGTHRLISPVTTTSYAVNGMIQAADSTYYLATDFGLFHLQNLEGNNYVRYLHDSGNPNSMTHNTVNDVHEDRSGRIWVATSRGLNQFLPETREFIRYFEKSGLPSSFIYGVLPDMNGHLWMSTNAGIVRFHPDGKSNQQLRFFDESDGIVSNEFNQGAFHYHFPSQTISFGGLDGVTWFSPGEITDNPNPPRVAFTSARILDRPVNLLEYSTTGRVLEIDSRDYFFSVEFSALDFVNPARNNYTYMLEGFDKDWIELGNRRFVTFTNLDAGSYQLRVKASNADGVWNEQGSLLAIKIVPPFYKTRWFLVLSILMVAGGIFFYIRYRALQFRKRNAELEQLVEARTAELRLSQEQLIHTEKMRVVGQLASGIAHDINNVLSIILGSANLLFSKHENPGLRKQLTVIEKAALDGAYIISQLQEFSRQAADERVTALHIGVLLEDVLEMTQYRINERRKKESIQIKFVREFTETSRIYGNQAELRASFTNLLLNAIDAFQNDGTIRIQTGQPTRETVEVRITDNAVGMDEGTVKKIFEPFFTTKGVKGSGLGLSQVFGAVSRHRGTIDVLSEPGAGTTFIIRFPAFTGKETDPPAPAPELKISQDAGLILIVEDEPDIRAIYQEVLGDLGHKGLFAATGEEGLDLWKANRQSINLIISDIGLPGMSGWDFIAEIRKQTTNLPVLVITGWGNEIPAKQIDSLSISKVISKPFTITQLIREIQVFLNPTVPQ